MPCAANAMWEFHDSFDGSKIASIAKAGTLFIVEEASSHFKKEQMSNIFYGGGVCRKESYITLRTLTETQQQFYLDLRLRQVLQPWRLSSQWIWVWHSLPIFIISDFRVFYIQQKKCCKDILWPRGHVSKYHI